MVAVGILAVSKAVQRERYMVHGCLQQNILLDTVVPLVGDFCAATTVTFHSGQEGTTHNTVMM